MMKQISIFLLLFMMAGTAMADRRQDLLEIIDDELSEVSRLNSQINSKNPSLILRMAELYLEKARIYKDIENQKFLTLPYEKRGQVDRKKWFKTSRSYFIKAQKACYFILKRFKRFKGRGDVYYVLAFNAKEFQQDEKALKYFTLAIKNTKKGSTTNSKAKLALAEMYYNKKDYKRAIPYYEASLTTKSSKWYTKDAHNLAWCYFREGRKTKAIDLMNKIYELSKDPQYYDMSKEVERDLAFFYTDSGKINNAVGFYKKSGRDIVSNLIKVSKLLMDQGKYSQAEKVLVQARSYKTNPKDSLQIADSLISLYEKFGRVGAHLQVAKELTGYHKQGLLDEAQFENLKYQVKRMAALLQKQVAGKTYKRQRKVLDQKARYAVGYFELEAELEPANAYLSWFHIGETYYAIGEPNKAIDAYAKANELAREANNAKIRSLSLNGMMASLGQKGVSSANKDKYLESVYKRLIAADPGSKKSYTIYQRLFSSQYDKGNIGPAIETLYAFKGAFPDSHKTQEAMLARVMDYYKKKRDVPALKQWVAKINAGEFKVSGKYAKTVNVYLLTVQFEGAESANTAGDKVKAIKYYATIFNDPNSSKTAKANAVYNIAVLYHEAGNSVQAHRYMKRSLELMSAGEVRKFEKTFLTMVNELFNRQRLDMSSELFEILLDKVCRSSSKNKNLFFKNAGFIYIANGQPISAENLIRKYGGKCQIKSRFEREIRRDVLAYLVDRNDWSSIEKLIPDYEKDNRLYPDLIRPAFSLRQAYEGRGNASKMNEWDKKMNEFYRDSRAKGYKIPLEALDVVAVTRLDGVNRVVNQLNNTKLSFPEATYNRNLQSKFKLLDELTSGVLRIFDVGSGIGIIRGYRLLVDNYNAFHDEIVNFSPPGKSPEYIKSFQGSMKQLARPLAQKVADFRREARKQIEKNEILSPDNYIFMTDANIPFSVRHKYLKKGVLMDRGGGK